MRDFNKNPVETLKNFTKTSENTSSFPEKMIQKMTRFLRKTMQNRNNLNKKHLKTPDF